MDIREKGIDELSAKLNRMGAGFDGFMVQTMDKAILYVHSQVPAYPASAINKHLPQNRNAWTVDYHSR